MMIEKTCKPLNKAAIGLLLGILGYTALAGQSIDFPSRRWGISFGNSRLFTGLRINFSDSRVQRITGINLTFWQPRKDNKEAVVEGLSIGCIPGGGYLRGIQIGLLGASADKSMKGFNAGGLGIGAGEDLLGINIGGLGAGAGNNVTGLNIGGVGIGAGKRLVGITIAGIGAGAGEKIIGLTICGIGAGSREIRGATISGVMIKGEILKGIHLSLGTVCVKKKGEMRGFAASAFNNIRGRQSGLTIGIVNYAESLKGLQIGLVNIVRSNPKYLKVLPLFNTGF